MYVYFKKNMEKKLNKILFINFWLEIIWLFIIFIIPIIFSYWSGSSNMFELPKAVIFCILTEALVALYLLKIFLQNKISFNLNYRFIILLGLWLIAIFVSLFLSFDFKESFWGSFERQQGVWFTLHLIAFFFILIFNIKNFRQIKRILLIIVSSSFFVCFYGLIQFFRLDFFNWAESAFNIQRIFSTLGQPNFLGHFLIIIIPVTIYYLFFGVKKNIPKFLLIILLFAEIFCLFASLSRGAWLGFGTEIFIFFLFLAIFFQNKFLKNKKNIFIGIIIFCIVAIFLVVFIDNSQNILKKRLNSALNFNSGSVKMRIFYWQSTWKELKQAKTKNLLFGYGPENLDNIFVKYYNKEWGIHEEVDSFPDRAHNIIFDLILSYGAIGLVVSIIFWFFILKQLIKYSLNNKHRPKYFWLAITNIVVFFGYFVDVLFSFSIIATSVLLFVFVSISYFLLSEESKFISWDLSFFSNISKILIFIFFLFFVGVIIWLFNIRPILADYYYGQVVKEANTDARCLPIMRNLNKVIYYQPDSTYYQRKYIYYHLNCLRDKNLTAVNEQIKYNIDQILDIIDKPVLDYRLNFKLAHTYSLFGYYFNEKYYKIADQAYQNLLKINPNFLGIYSDYGRMFLWQQKYGQAINILKKGLENTPDLNSFYLNNEHRDKIYKKLFVFYDALGQAYFYQKDYEEAINYFKKALRINPMESDIYKKLGDCYYMQGKLAEATLYYKKSLSLNPNNNDLTNSLLLIY